MISFRVEQVPPRPGAVLMAEDRDLLERAERGEGEPVLRLYEWDQPTVSLGFHQAEDSLDAGRLAVAQIPWVRRPTGGAAVLHSQELTYAVILPLGVQAGEAALVQEFIARAIAGGLREIGVVAEVDSRGEPLSALPNRVSCFVRTSRWEVTAHGRKLVGSAQRKLTRAVLQHGSILTGDDHLRIVDVLRVKDEAAREALRSRLLAKSTSASAELGRSVEPSALRDVMEQNFIRVFAGFPRNLDSTVATN
jgi:lipoyl(octanoyl) transferase